MNSSHVFVTLAVHRMCELCLGTVRDRDSWTLAKVVAVGGAVYIC
jgi:hypothetical protein